MNLVGTSEAINAEESVLGAVFLDPNVLDDIAYLEARDFTGIRSEIYRVMKYLNENNKPVDIITVTEEYVKFGKIQDMGGVEYLSKLAESCPSSTHAFQYAGIVRSKAVRRRGKSTAKQIETLSEEDFETDEEYFAAIENLISELRPKEAGMMRSIKETRKNYFDHLKKQVEFILTGFKEYDNWSNGLGRGDLHILAGRPSVGKTAMLLQRAIGVAKHKRAGAVLIFSQEMGEEELKDRMICQLTGIAFSRIKQKKLSDSEWAKVEEAYEKLEELPIYIQDTPGVTIEEVRAKTRQIKRKIGRIAVVAVDYLQIMSIPQKKNDTRAQAIGRVTTSAKQLAREMDCCFLMLSQMTRESEQKKKPQMSDLKESGSIEQDADVIEFLWHDPNDYEPGKKGKVVQQFIAKGRNIGINEFRLLFKGWLQYFDELPKRSFS
jgi:replicative DNA helicase